MHVFRDVLYEKTCHSYLSSLCRSNWNTVVTFFLDSSERYGFLSVIMIGGCLSQKMMQNSVGHFHLWYVVSGFTLIGERNFKSRLTDIPPLLHYSRHPEDTPTCPRGDIMGDFFHTVSTFLHFIFHILGFPQWQGTRMQKRFQKVRTKWEKWCIVIIWSTAKLVALWGCTQGTVVLWEANAYNDNANQRF